VAFDLSDPPESVLAFLQQRCFASLTTIRPGDGGLHAALVGFTYVSKTAEAFLILRGSGVKQANLRAADGPSSVVLCQINGGKWLSLEGLLTVHDNDDMRATALAHYRKRYGEGVAAHPTRLAGVLQVTRMYGFVG
jgi:F420H(2)-dependent biliverdin reductase